MKSVLPLGDLLRRARRELGLSQAALALSAGVSQASLSYYERGQTIPGRDVIRRLEETLELAPGTLGDAKPGGWTPGAQDIASPAVQDLIEHRRLLMASFEELLEPHAILDKPAGETGGDLAFAMDLRSHAFFAVLDGTGFGTPAALSSLLAASAMIGAQSGRGAVVWPEEIVEASLSLERLVAGEERLAEVFVALHDRRHRELFYCYTSFPTPYLRTRDGVLRYLGGDDRSASWAKGRIKLGPDDMLVIATDGLAHLATKSQRTYWATREARAVIRESRTPEEVIHRLERRARTTYGGQGTNDDLLALAISL